LVDSGISSIDIISFSNEIRCLWSMSYDVLFCRILIKNASNSFSACNKPGFTNSMFHCLVIFPININSIEIVLNNKICHWWAKCCWVISRTCWIFCGSESWNQYFDIFLMIQAQKILLDCRNCSSKRTTLLVHKSKRLSPNLNRVCRSIVQ